MGQGQGCGQTHLPAPYTIEDAAFPFLWQALGYVVFTFMAKDLWNIHLMYTAFAADELVILPETIMPKTGTEYLFLFGGRDCYVPCQESVAYIQDMFPASHISTAVIPEEGHGTFLLLRNEWRKTIAIVDKFFGHRN